MASQKRVAIIGGGPSGIVALKTVKQYGHNAICFEKESSFGGMWRMNADMKKMGYDPKPDVKHGGSPIYKSLLMNTSIYFSAFSDYPVEVDITDAYWKPDDYLIYLDDYIKHFNLRRDIQFNTCVNAVEKVGDKWKLHFRSKDDATFDNVIMTTGPYRHGSMPDYKGLDQYQGIAIHSGQVKNDEILFKDKNVIIVGAGNSGQEIACSALIAGARKVYVTLAPEGRRLHFTGTHYCPHPDVDDKKVPYDCYLTRNSYIDHPEKFSSFLKKSWPLSSGPISPDYIPQPPKDGLVITRTDVMMAKEQNGVLQKIPDIHHFLANGVELIDGSTLNDINVVVFSTGFQARFPILDGLWSAEEQNKCELYKYIIPVPSRMDGLSFMSTANTLSSLFPVMEMQARYICEKVLTRDYDEEGHVYTQTEREAMLKDIEQQKEFNHQMKREYNYFVDAPSYTRNLAMEIECDPVQPTQMLKDAKSKEEVELAIALQYGPLIGPQYRLKGPYAWPGAADYLIKVSRQIYGEKFDQLVDEHFRNI